MSHKDEVKKESGKSAQEKTLIYAKVPMVL